MLQLHTPPAIYVILLAGVFTLASWVGYGIEGIRQVQSAEKG